MGICMVCMGYVDLGVNTMVEAVTLAPEAPKLRSSLAEVLRLLGRFPQAEAEFRWSLQLNPLDAGVTSTLGLTLAQQGRLGEAEPICRAALAMNDTVPAVHYRLGFVLAQQGRHHEVRACFEAALAAQSGVHGRPARLSRHSRPTRDRRRNSGSRPLRSFQFS